MFVVVLDVLGSNEVCSKQDWCAYYFHAGGGGGDKIRTHPLSDIALQMVPLSPHLIYVSYRKLMCTVLLRDHKNGLSREGGCISLAQLHVKLIHSISMHRAHTCMYSKKILIKQCRDDTAMVTG